MNVSTNPHSFLAQRKKPLGKSFSESRVTSSRASPILSKNHVLNRQIARERETSDFMCDSKIVFSANTRVRTLKIGF